MEMSHLLSNKDGEISEGNRYYWKISKLLPVGVKFAHKKFKLHNKLCHCCPFFLGDELHVCIIVSRFSHDQDRIVPFFNVRIGIVREDLVELASLKAEPPTDSVSDMFTVASLIRRSQLDSPMLYLFVEMRRKDDNIELVKRKIKALEKQQCSGVKIFYKDMLKIEKDYSELIISGQNSDIIIEVKHKKFNCHRCILGARSPVFAAMMQHDMKEKTSGVVTITDAKPVVFQDFLLYLYSGNDTLVNWKNVTDLYKLADKYVVEDLKNLCLEHIKKNITMENFYNFFKLSQIHNDSELTKTSVQFFLKKSKKIVRSENWMKFLEENLVECNLLITALADKY